MKHHGRFTNLLSRLTTRRLETFGTDSEAGFAEVGEEAGIHEGANVVCSRYPGESWDGEKYHAILLDLDVPAYLMPSSTEGNSHLYIDASIPEDDYYALLDLLAEHRILEPGYVSASKNNGGTYLRLPWVKKGQEF